MFDRDGEDEDAIDRAAVVQAVVVAEEAADSAPHQISVRGAARSNWIPLQPVGVQFSQVLPEDPVRLLVGGDVFVVEAAVCP
ncbi:hypothetical protein ACFTZK_00020 [Streptomyces decoyicus]|uniref:hypothetical protein n=1 Tax=Streptomyces decoyicus TaxID=249567 RepID=UPI003639651C